MGKAAKERLNQVLIGHLNTIHETFQVLDQSPSSSLDKVSWNDVVKIGEQIYKQATTVGMLWTGEGPEAKALEESMATYSNLLQGFLLLSHGSMIGAGPTLSSCIHASVKQVVDCSFMLLKESVSSYGNSSKAHKLSIPQLVGTVWEACSALKKTPATNITAIGRAMTQVAVSIKDVLREMNELKPVDNNIHLSDTSPNEPSNNIHVSENNSSNEASKTKNIHVSATSSNEPSNTDNNIHVSYNSSNRPPKTDNHIHVSDTSSNRPDNDIHVSDDNSSNEASNTKNIHVSATSSNEPSIHVSNNSSNGPPKTDNNIHVSDTSSDEDLGSDLSPEEMKLAESATTVVSETLSTVKEVIRSITGLLKNPQTEIESQQTVDSLEKLLTICRNVGLQVDEIGACLYPPQELAAISAASGKLGGLVGEMRVELETIGGCTEGFVNASRGLVGLLRVLESELERCSDGELVGEMEKLDVDE